MLKHEWKYFIVLNNKNSYGEFVEDVEYAGEIPCCGDVKVVKSFKTPEMLLEWVKKNTPSLTIENNDFKIEGQYLPTEN